jgi:hypothetical protein
MLMRFFSEDEHNDALFYCSPVRSTFQESKEKGMEKKVDVQHQGFAGRHRPNY